MEFMLVRNTVCEKSQYVLRNEIEVMKAINTGGIENYRRMPEIRMGTILTCCKLSESLDPSSMEMKGSGYHTGLTFKVTFTSVDTNSFIAFGAKRNNGVYLSNIRLATKEEADRFIRINKKESNNLDNLRWMDL